MKFFLIFVVVIVEDTSQPGQTMPDPVGVAKGLLVAVANVLKTELKKKIKEVDEASVETTGKFNLHSYTVTLRLVR